MTMISLFIPDIIHDIIYDTNYDITGIGQCSIRSAAALPGPCAAPAISGIGLAATLPRLCRPDPALADPLGPDPLRLGYRNHPGPYYAAVAPHPDVHLVEPAAVTVPLPDPAACRRRRVQYADRP